MSITAPTAADLHRIAEHALASPHQPADAIQGHDAGDEADEVLQRGLYDLAARCGSCGQALPEAIA